LNQQRVVAASDFFNKIDVKRPLEIARWMSRLWQAAVRMCSVDEQNHYRTADLPRLGGGVATARVGQMRTLDGGAGASSR